LKLILDVSPSLMNRSVVPKFWKGGEGVVAFGLGVE
jgi:hypothetical protein